ncbi:hypothetical protein Cni_G20805 [Canna indica]|uniref:DC1 domain-containing protein n=1 Tax=Canna indica TaxID=4628 RepID=A0AAQ3KTS2_9LILI|nr:hypothetical protein Cni_G20805 [Canna indica]
MACRSQGTRRQDDTVLPSAAIDDTAASLGELQLTLMALASLLDPGDELRFASLNRAAHEIGLFGLILGMLGLRFSPDPLIAIPSLLFDFLSFHPPMMVNYELPCWESIAPLGSQQDQEAFWVWGSNFSPEYLQPLMIKCSNEKEQEINMNKKPRNLRNTSSNLGLIQSMPTSKPQLQLQGDQLLHFGHPQHPLLRISLPYIFTCMGCKEYGAGNRFRCHTCSFDLHDFCALAPLALQNHPFHPKHQLAFFTKPGGFRRSRCDVCGKAAKGYAFRCTTCSFEMHPCCAAMRVEMNFLIHQHPLTLSPATSVHKAADSSSMTCNVCRRTRSGQIYRCAACGYYLHAVCAKDMVNGLYVHGFRSPERSSNNKLGTAARMATQALFEIIGGLIEGIGEGIGEALFENIGRCMVRSVKHT